MPACLRFAARATVRTLSHVLFFHEGLGVHFSLNVQLENISANTCVILSWFCALLQCHGGEGFQSLPNYLLL